MSLIRKAILGVVLNGLALYGVAYFLEDVTYSGGLTFFAVGGLVIGILNTVIKPVLKTLAIPLVFFTAGFFLIVINVAVLWLTKEIIDILAIDGVTLGIKGISTYLIAGFLFGLINWLEHLLVPTK